jgi:hypothetical protein
VLPRLFDVLVDVFVNVFVDRHVINDVDVPSAQPEQPVDRYS